MFIHLNDPTLNRNLGKHQLQHIWDSILQASPMLQLKPSSLHTSPTPTPPLNTTISPQRVHIPPHHPPPTAYTGGGMYLSWQVINARVQNTPTPPTHLNTPPYYSSVQVSCTILFVSLTFFSDLMKWP